MSSKACMSHPQVPTVFINCAHTGLDENFPLPEVSCSLCHVLWGHTPTTIHRASALELFKSLCSNPWLLLSVVVMLHKPESQDALTAGVSWVVHSNSGVFSVLVRFTWVQWEQKQLVNRSTATLSHLKMLLLSLIYVCHSTLSTKDNLTHLATYLYHRMIQMMRQSILCTQINTKIIHTQTKM